LVGECYLLDEGEVAPEVDPVGFECVVDRVVETGTAVLVTLLGFGGERLDESTGIDAKPGIAGGRCGAGLGRRDEGLRVG